MNALEALAPTFAMLHVAAAASVGPRAVSDRSPAIDFRKYIIVERNGRELAIVFPGTIRHDEGCPDRAGSLISAGSFIVANGTVILSGVGSATLNLPSRPQDAALIESLFSEST